MDFSVILPTFNGQSFIHEALESVWRQSRLPKEIIVVDDCSTDETASIARAIARNSPVPMSVHRLEKNTGGPAKPINYGISIAIGTYVAVLDQDDLFLPDRLECHLDIWLS